MPASRRVIFMSAKDPDEIAHVPGIDFGPLMTVPAESFSAGQVTITIVERDTGAPEAGMFVAGSVGVSNNVVSFRIQAGSDNHDYLATVSVATSATRIEQGEVVIPVRIRGRR